MVRTEVHEGLKEFNETKMKKGFTIPKLRVHDTRFIEQSVDLSFGGSEKDRIVSINQTPKANNSKVRGMSSKKLVKVDSSAAKQDKSKS